MQAIILAAGQGERLRPLTEDRPKCMVPISGEPLIVHSLHIIADLGCVNEVIIVCGYRAEVIQEYLGQQFRGMQLYYVINDIYKSTNNVYSLYLALEYIKEDCILLECDLYYEKEILDTLILSEADCAVLVSPFNQETMNGTVILSEGDRAQELLVKKHQKADMDYSAAYKTVNIYKFKKDFFLKKLADSLKCYVNWGNLQSYYELVIGSLIYYREDDIRLCMVDEALWYEVDDVNDYEKLCKAVQMSEVQR